MAKARLSLKERLFRGVIRDEKSECWLWTGTDNGYGYGVIGVDGKQAMVHRISYEMHIGPIPDGLVLDHLCRVRNCINPAHMEPVTIAENVRRGVGLGAGRTHCPMGHKYKTINIDGYHVCRICTRARSQTKRDSDRDAYNASVREYRARRRDAHNAYQREYKRKLALAKGRAACPYCGRQIGSGVHIHARSCAARAATA